jgi:hypothetical protein
VTALETAAAYGVAVLFEDLGDWGEAMLIAEYDPEGPAIRINLRALDRMCNDAAARAELVARAVAHELYHHREAIGDVPRYSSRMAREREAREHARTFDG